MEYKKNNNIYIPTAMVKYTVHVYNGQWLNII